VKRLTPQPRSKKKRNKKFPRSSRPVFIMLYSRTADTRFGHNIAVSNSGQRTKFTAIHKEREFGPWRNSYKWADATEVGFINDMTQIVEYNGKGL